MSSALHARQLELAGDDLVYRNDDGREFWRMPVKHICVVAEYTSPHGPWDEDWFLVFGYTKDGEFFFNEADNPAWVESILHELEHD